MIDPFSSVDELFDAPFGEGRKRNRQRTSKLPDLTPEDRQSLLDKVSGVGLSGLQWVGETLDKTFGGRTIRGLLGGEGLKSFAHLVPFSDALGLTDEGILGDNLLADKDTVPGGRELLEQTGMLQKNTPGFDMGDVVGFGAEILLDPSTYLVGPGMAAVKGAKAMAGSGKVVRTAADTISQIAEGERGLMGIKLPFADKPLRVFGTGQTASKVYEKMYYNPVSRYVRPLVTNNPFLKDSQLFHQIQADRELSDVLKHVDDIKMQALDAGKKLETELEPLYQGQLREVFEQNPDALDQLLGELPQGTTLSQLSSSDFIRALGEARIKTGNAIVDESKVYGPFQANTLRGKLNELNAAPEALQAGQKFDEFVDNWITLKDDVAATNWRMGGEITPLEDAFIGHVPRGINKSVARMIDKVGGKARTAFSNAMRRLDPVRDIPGGTATVQIASKDWRLTGVNDPLFSFDALNDMPLGGEQRNITQLRKQAWATDLPQDIGLGSPVGSREVRFGDEAVGVTPQIPGVVTKGMKKQLTKMGYDDDAIKLMSPEQAWAKIHGAPGANVYPRKPNLDDTTLNRLADAGVNLDEYGSTVTGYHPLEAAGILINEYNIPADKAMDLAKMLADLPGKMVLDGHGLYGHVLDDLTGYITKGSYANAGLRSMHSLLAHAAGEPADTLGPTVADALKQIVSPAKRPGEQLSPFDRALDFFREKYGETKGLAKEQVDPTLLHVPDVFVKTAKKFMEYNSDPKAVEGLLKGFDAVSGVIKGSLTVPFPAFHTRNFISGLWQNAVTAFENPLKTVGYYRKAINVLRGKEDDILKELQTLDLLPHGTGQLAEIFGDAAVSPEAVGVLGRTFNPLESISRTAENYKEGGIKGVAKGLGQWGTDAYTAVESLNRISHYLARIDQGWTKPAAAWSSKMAHFDYDTISKGSWFQANVLRRLMPFYSFTRFNLPTQVKNLIDQPGGRTAQTIRAINTAREEREGYVPAYLGEGFVQRLGGEGNAATFLSSTSLLPVEEAFNRFAFQGPLPDVVRTLEKTAAQTHPLFQAPAQLVADKQFFSGRKLSDLYSYPSGEPAIDFLLANSPASRALSTVRSATDPRKEAWQKLTNFLLGGVRVTDVDTQKALYRDSQSRLTDKLGPDPNIREITNLYVRPEDFEKLSPEQAQELSLFYYLQSELKRMSKQARQSSAK